MAESQLNLNLDVKYDASLGDFAGPGWLTIIDAIRQLHVGLISQLYLFGEANTGKSHLLSATCESFIEMNQSAINLSLKDLLHTNVDVLASLEHFDVIAIDDVDAIVGYRMWQEGIFHLFNRSKEEQKRLIFSSRVPANELDFELRDIMTRLAQAPSFKVPDGENIADREAFVEAVMQRRGWHFDHRVIQYLLKEGPHRIGAMMKVLTHLQPMFANLPRTNIPKAAVNDAIKTIDEQTLLVELEDIQEQTIHEQAIAEFEGTQFV